MADPFRERRLSPAETRRIVRRAVELADLNRRAADDGATVTGAELTRHLGDLGLPPDAVQRAMASSLTEGAAVTDDPLRIVFEEDVDGMLRPEHHETIAEAMSAAMGMRGRVEVVGGRLTWTPGGLLAEPSVTVHAREGRTHVRIEETLANRGQVWVGSAALAGFAAFFAIVPGMVLGRLAATPGTALFTAIVACVAILCGWGGAVGFRKLFERRRRTRTRFLDEVMAKVVAAVHGQVVAPRPGRRVDASTVDAEAGARDEDAQAEAEAADAERDADAIGARR